MLRMLTAMPLFVGDLLGANHNTLSRAASNKQARHPRSL